MSNAEQDQWVNPMLGTLFGFHPFEWMFKRLEDVQDYIRRVKIVSSSRTFLTKKGCDPSKLSAWQLH